MGHSLNCKKVLYMCEWEGSGEKTSKSEIPSINPTVHTYQDP